MSQIHVYKSKKEIGDACSAQLRVLSDAAANEGRLFTVGISGGSLPSILAEGMPSAFSGASFDHWRLFFTDERCVGWEHDDSNYKEVKTKLLDVINFPLDNVLGINENLIADPKAAAEEYEQRLLSLGNDIKTTTTSSSSSSSDVIPSFDLLLLGMGPDGHTCSLFPGHQLLDEKTRLVADITDSPKPPSNRITLTFPIVNKAKRSWFVTAGASKAEALTKNLKETSPSLPSGRVKSLSVAWFVDEAAATFNTNL